MIKYLLFISATLLTLACSGRGGVGGPDAHGYSWIDSDEANGPAFQWIEPDSKAVPIVVGSSQTAGNIDLELPWPIYGEEVSRLRVSRNGFITTLLTDPGGDETNDCPLPSSPSQGGGHRIYPLHDNVELDSSDGAIYYRYYSDSPHPYNKGPVHVITWLNAHHPGPDTSRFHFQVLLFDNHDILIQLPTGNPEKGGGSTTGIQNDSATTGLGVICDKAVLGDDYAVAIRLPSFLVTNANDSGAGYFGRRFSTQVRDLSPAFISLHTSVSNALFDSQVAN